MLNVQRSISSALLAAAAFLLLPGRAAQPDPKAVVITLPDKIEWKKGAAQDSVLLQGDPTKPGVYIQMIKWHPGNMSRPHFHSTDRFIYVVSGTWWVGTGSKYDPSSTYPVPAGSYVIDKANEIHYDGAKDADCVLYLVGTGPMTTTQAEKK
jgi:quercetin dioxygenase-like cupin family protein